MQLTEVRMSLDNSRNRSHEETLSALMDNEADELELRRLLKELQEEPALAETWKRFHLARSVLHNEEMLVVSRTATNRILAAIAAEPAYDADVTPAGDFRNVSQARSRSVWLASAGRVAIAASVALAVFTGLQTTMFTSQSDMSVAGSDDEAESVVTEAAQLAVNDDFNGFDAEAQRRLNDYIRSVSIQYGVDAGATPEFNILQDSQLIRQVNQIEVQPAN